MRHGDLGDSDQYLRRVTETNALATRIRFLLAYSQLAYFNQPIGCLDYASEIEASRFAYWKELSEIKTALSSDPPGSKKYKVIAVPLSMAIPGSGQVYAGFYFDGVQSFGFNAILGYAAYASWRHELDLDRGKRNYVLPIISSVVSGVFYLSNLVNTLNAVNKTNARRLDTHYSAILDQFRLVIDDDDYFLSIMRDF